MSTFVQNLLLRRTIVIQAPPAHVFEVFVNGLNLWWPRTHHIGKAQDFTAKLEPRMGGRWYEVGPDGEECDWGRVLAWEPPRRIVLSWDISAHWRHDPGIANEVEVLFVAEPGDRTRVELEHRKIERYGDEALSMFDVLGSESGWSGVLKCLATVAENGAGKQ
jgi:uncharacterized protein YndB with AHSA1/START domain